jgi:trans-2,3-dihydro-3-hydroxyanthranilate isomerase
MTQPEPRVGPELEREAVSALLGGAEPASAPVVCRTALPQAFVELGDRAELARLGPDLAGIATLEGVVGLAAWCEDPPGVVSQRFFAPALGIPEDPATGSAAGALGALRVHRGVAPGRLTISQGAEVGRPSTISVEVGGEPGRAELVRVGGHAVLVLEAAIDRELLS